MDELVLRSMAKWPNVPAVFGWLRLDRRGDWWIRGERLENLAIRAYIARNYAHDDKGRWFFQNGPQRVFVTLAYTPLVLRVASVEGAPLAFEAHTGSAVRTVNGAWMDEDGALLLATEVGMGVVDDRDLPRLPPYLLDAGGEALSEDAIEERVDRLQQGETVPLRLAHRDTTLEVGTLRRAEVPARFGFVQDPRPVGENRENAI